MFGGHNARGFPQNMRTFELARVGQMVYIFDGLSSADGWMVWGPRRSWKEAPETDRLKFGTLCNR